MCSRYSEVNPYSEFGMIPNEEQSNLLCRIAGLRQERSAKAGDIYGQLLDTVDVYVWHADTWLKYLKETEGPSAEPLDLPQEYLKLSLWALSSLALEGLGTASECLRADITYPGAWLLRNLLEARTNAIFIACEPTGLAGERWINYNLHREARLERDSTPAKQLIDGINKRFPNDNINRDGWWAKTKDPDGNDKLYGDLTARANYVEQFQPSAPGFLSTLRQASHQHELDMISKANLSVHPMLAGRTGSPHPIQVLYWGSQATWDILRACSVGFDLPLSDDVIRAHDRFEITCIEVGRSQVAQDP